MSLHAGDEIKDVARNISMMDTRQLDAPLPLQTLATGLERRAQRGFSMIELSIVVLILGILAAMVVPNILTTTQTTRMASDLRSISAQISLARMRAASQASKSRLNFDLSANTYQIEVWNGSSWVIYGAVSSLGTGDTFGFGSVTTPAGQQSTIAQTSPIYFNSRGIATDSSGTPIGTSAIYFGNSRAQYGALAVSIAGQPTAYTYSGSAWVAY
jgi:prepilin-type N-terminal cleavage/methylation domain-containing protein